LFDQSRTTLIQYPAGKVGGYTIPHGVTYISELAFPGCSGLTSVTIPNSVTTIGESTFFECTGLTTVTIPNSVTFIGVTAFAGCSGLTAIMVDPLNSTYGSLEGVLFDQSETTLIQYPFGRAGGYTIPRRVTQIGERAFSGRRGLTAVTVPNSVTFIARQAFSDCSGLKGIYFQGQPPALPGGFIPGPGNPPGRPFLGSDQVIVYYLPRQPGWGDTFGDRPTALWRPRILVGDASFGVRDNQLEFDVAWAPDQVVVTEASTDLTQPAWTPLQTNVLTAVLFHFSDPQWTNQHTRFYRLRAP
jgi:hypothetical protein